MLSDPGRGGRNAPETRRHRRARALRRRDHATYRPEAPGRARRPTPRVPACAAIVALLGCGAAEPVEPGATTALQLRALGYVEWAPLDAAEARRLGVVAHDPARARPGLNLYSSRGDDNARLVDMNGTLVHEWQSQRAGDAWNAVEFAPNRDLLVLSRGESVERLDRSSNVRWRAALAAHHDVTVDPEGRIYTLASAVVPGTPPILDERIVELTPDGRVVRSISLHGLLGKRLPRDPFLQPPPPWWRRLLRRSRVDRAADVYHANSLEILPRDVPGLGGRGDALVSLRNLDRVVVVDLDGPQLVWSWGPGVVEGQHDATLLPNGNLLVFDNGRRRGWSRVVEVDPRTARIVWEYSGNPARSLFSARQGACQKLAGGNVLVTESERGRAVEVTPDGEVVWEFLNPRLDEQERSRRSIYRMRRLSS